MKAKASIISQVKNTLKRLAWADELSGFYGPPNNTGFGVHAPPTNYLDVSGLYTDWDLWKPRLIALGISWMKIMDDGSGSSIKTAHRLITECDIMPIVRFYRERPNPHRITSREVDTARRYVGFGAVYFETNNEPDLALEWDRKYLDNGWLPQNWLDTVVNNFIMEAGWIRDAGGWLLFPAFGPGGMGGSNPFQMIVDKGHVDLFHGNICAAVHNYTLSRPWEYPEDEVNQLGTSATVEEYFSRAPDKINGEGWKWAADGLTIEQMNEFRENDKKPGSTPMTDSTCWRAFEFVDAQVMAACGHHIPVFTTEGGYNMGQRGTDGRYFKQGPKETAEAQVAALKHPRPEWFIPAGLWHLAGYSAGLGSEFEYQFPWYTPVLRYDWNGCDGGQNEDETPTARMIIETEWPVDDIWPTPPTWGNDIDEDTPGGGIMTWFQKYYDTLDAQPANHCGAYGVTFVRAEGLTDGELYFHLVGAVKISCVDNNQRQNLFIDVVDVAGQRLVNSQVNWKWQEMKPGEKLPNPVNIDKPPTEIPDLPIWANTHVDAWGKGYRKDGKFVEVKSDRANGFHADFAMEPDEAGCSWGHHSYYLLFRLEPWQGDTEPPIEPPAEGCEEIIEAARNLEIVVGQQVAVIDAALSKIKAARAMLEGML